MLILGLKGLNLKLNSTLSLSTQVYKMGTSDTLL